MINKSVGLKVLILPLSSAAVIMIVALFIKPAYSDVNALKKAVGEDKKQLEQLKTQNVKMKEMKSSLISMEEKPMVMLALPEREDAEKYLAEFYGRVNRSGVLMKNFKFNESSETLLDCGKVSGAPLPSSGGESASVVTGSSAVAVENNAAISQPTGTVPAENCAKTSSIDVSVSGSWDQVLSFLKYIEDTSRVANISKIEIAPGQSGGDQGMNDILNVRATLDIFSKTKSENANIMQINSLTSEGGINKGILRKIESAIYGTFDYNYETEKTAGKNIFK
jgi:Tfp pilus assembly protein PilO